MVDSFVAVVFVDTMTYRRGIEELNDRISKLRQAIARRDWLQRQREALAAQMVYRRDRADELAKQLAKEQRDVEKLDRDSPSGLAPGSHQTPQHQQERTPEAKSP